MYAVRRMSVFLTCLYFEAIVGRFRFALGFHVESHRLLFDQIPFGLLLLHQLHCICMSVSSGVSGLDFDGGGLAGREVDGAEGAEVVF